MRKLGKRLPSTIWATAAFIASIVDATRQASATLATPDARGAVADGLRVLVAVQVEQDASGELTQPQRPEVADGALEVACELPEEQRAVAAFEADLVVMHDDRGTEAGHGASVHRIREGRHSGRPSGHAIHLHSGRSLTERLTEDAVVDRPAPAPHGLSEAGPAKGRRAVETPTQATAGLESRVDLVHSIAADEVAAAVALVVQRGVIEERLHEIEVATEQAAKIVHALEHVSEHAEALAHLSRRQPG